MLTFIRIACDLTVFLYSILRHILLSNPDCYLSLSAVLRVAGSLQKSTEVMKAMQSLVKIPEIQATMRDLSKEMMKVPWGHPMSCSKALRVSKRQGLGSGLGRSRQATVARQK